MAYLLIWSPRALEDLESVAAYISRDSTAYAASVVRTILSKARVLSAFPYSGRVVPEFDDESIREIFAYSYRIIYRAGEAEVEIAAVVHGKRQLEQTYKP